MGITLLIFTDKSVFCCSVDTMIPEYRDKLSKTGLYACLISEWYISLIFFTWVLWKTARTGILVSVWSMIGPVTMFLSHKNTSPKWYSALIANAKSSFSSLKKRTPREVL